MKLKEYMQLVEPGAEITCWDKDVDSEFYLYAPVEGKNSSFGDDFKNLDKYMERLPEFLDVKKIHDGGIEVNLYEVLEHPQIIEYAKEHLYDTRQYENDAGVTMLLFDDNVTNISQGYDEFSRCMIECLDLAYNPEKLIEAENTSPELTTERASILLYNAISLLEESNRDTGLEDEFGVTSDDYKTIIESQLGMTQDEYDFIMGNDEQKKTVPDKKQSLTSLIQAAEEKSAAQIIENNSPAKDIFERM